MTLFPFLALYALTSLLCRGQCKEIAVFQRELSSLVFVLSTSAVYWFTESTSSARRLGARGARAGWTLAEGVLRRILGLTVGLQRQS